MQKLQSHWEQIQNRLRLFQQSWLHRALALAVAIFWTHQAFAGHYFWEKESHAPEHEPAPPASDEPRSPGLVGVININQAGLKTWQLFPGVGPAIAQRIVDYRRRKAFHRVLQLRRVRGIGPKFLRRFAPHLRLQGPSTLRQQK